jgi:hypothetical protein
MMLCKSSASILPERGNRFSLSQGERFPQNIRASNREPLQIQRPDLARMRKPFLPLLGERAGVRAVFFIFTSLLGIHDEGRLFLCSKVSTK